MESLLKELIPCLQNIESIEQLNQLHTTICKKLSLPDQWTQESFFFEQLVKHSTDEKLSPLIDTYLKLSPMTKTSKKRLQKWINNEKKKGKRKLNTTSQQDTSDPKLYFENRVKQFGQDLKAYPHKFEVSMSISEFKKRYHEIENGSTLKDDVVSIAGRIIAKRVSGQKLVFYRIISEGTSLQVLSNCAFYHNEQEFSQFHHTTRRGDVIGIIGYPGKSQRGELSIIPTKCILLVPCLQLIPKKIEGEERYKQRYLDLLINMDSRNKFVMRSKLVKELREYFVEHGYVEVETPVLTQHALDRDCFSTFHNALGMNLNLRTNMGLFLKQLLIGDMGKVFEIGRTFKNEDVDNIHNIEYTFCEFYCAYSDIEDAMKMIQQLMLRLALKLCGGSTLNYQVDTEKSITIDFSKPFERVSMISALEKRLNIKMPKDLNTEESRLFLKKLVENQGIECKPPKSNARLLEKLVEIYVRRDCKAPTFITDFPIISNPFAKCQTSNTTLIQHFEVVIGGKRIITGCTELNDSKALKSRILKAIECGDLRDFDFNVLTALEYGMSPCFGCSISIDLLSMILSNSQHIKDVILFPFIRPTSSSCSLEDDIIDICDQILKY